MAAGAGVVAAVSATPVGLVASAGLPGCGLLAGCLSAAATRLATLDLGNNWIGDAGATALAAVLPQCKALATLDLTRNQIGGAAKLALKSAAQQLLRLEL